MIPLAPEAEARYRQALQQLTPAWAELLIAYMGTYLGFTIGPQGYKQLWDKPLAKLMQRATLWAQQPLGLHLQARTHNVFGVSVLAFVAQLAQVTDEAQREAERAMIRWAPGPGTWCVAQDLWYLKELCGLPVAFASLKVQAWAAKIRVARFDPTFADPHELVRRADGLRDAIRQSDLRSQWAFAKWYQQSFTFELERAVDTFSQQILPRRRFHSLHSAKYPRDDQGQRPAGYKGQYQRHVAQYIRQALKPDVEDRIRHKMQRWG